MSKVFKLVWLTSILCPPVVLPWPLAVLPGLLGLRAIIEKGLMLWMPIAIAGITIVGARLISKTVVEGLYIEACSDTELHVNIRNKQICASRRYMYTILRQKKFNCLTSDRPASSMANENWWVSQEVIFNIVKVNYIWQSLHSAQSQYLLNFVVRKGRYSTDNDVADSVNLLQSSTYSQG